MRLQDVSSCSSPLKWFFEMYRKMDEYHCQQTAEARRDYFRIILLLLYLALDDADARPLTFDKPEEKLDPKSVYDELVDLFIAAKATREAIMVTHNGSHYRYRLCAIVR